MQNGKVGDDSFVSKAVTLLLIKSHSLRRLFCQHVSKLKTKCLFSLEERRFPSLLALLSIRLFKCDYKYFGFKAL